MEKEVLSFSPQDPDSRHGKDSVLHRGGLYRTLGSIFCGNRLPGEAAIPQAWQCLRYLGSALNKGRGLRQPELLKWLLWVPLH